MIDFLRKLFGYPPRPKRGRIYGHKDRSQAPSGSKNIGVNGKARLTMKVVRANGDVEYFEAPASVSSKGV